MRRFFGLTIVPMVLAGAGVFAACGGEVDTQYGPPGGLRGAHLPDPTGTGTGTTPPADGGAPPSDGGMGGDVVAMNCMVSFKTQVFPMMQTAGTWKCSSSTCHGGATPPAISPTDATAAYNSLKAYIINGKAYFNSASMDPLQSTFECNLKGTCGAGQMPIPGGAVGAVAATTAELTTVDTWVKCGAPNN